MSAKQKRTIREWIVSSIILAVAGTTVFLLLGPPVGAENEIVPLWGSSFSKICYWHNDTSETDAGDTVIWYEGYYHWDTISLTGWTRSDGKDNEPISLPNVWKYDGFKLFLNVDNANLGAECSIRVNLTMGINDSNYVTKTENAAEGEGLKSWYDFITYYTDSIALGDNFDVTVIVGDTVSTGETYEMDRKVKISGALFGID